MSSTESAGPRLPADVLLQHVGWVRALARRLVGDPELADDLTQETCVRALQRPPAAGLQLRAWLATVLRNLASNERRGSRHRLRSLATMEPPDAPPSVDDLVARAGLHRDLVDAVLALDEPYRRVLLMRFFDDLPPRRIAQQLGVPVSTVHTRITRGLARLRERLDRHAPGGRRGWLAVALPMTAPQAPLTTILGAFAVNKIAMTIVGGLGLLAIATWAAWPSAARSASPRTADGSALVAGNPVAAANPDPGTTHRRRAAETLDDDPRNAERDVAAPVAKVSLRGRLVDTTGAPIAAAQVALGTGAAMWNDDAAPDDAPRADTDETGAFELEAAADSPLTRGQGFAQVAMPGWITAMAGRLHPDATTLVVAARARRLAGTVIDETGAPVADAVVRAPLAPGVRTALSANADRAVETVRMDRTDAGGHFDLVAAVCEDAVLLASHPGYEPAEQPLPHADDGAMQLVLHRRAPSDTAIAGRVVDLADRPVEGAWVGLGMASTTTDGAGEFVLPIGEGGPDDRILAVKRGHLPAHLERSGDAWPATVTLRLGEEPQSLAGTVVDAEGLPMPGVRVWVRDATVFGPLTVGGTASVEGLLAGAATRQDLMAMLQAGDRSPEQILDTTPTVDWPWVRTDASGRFAFGGLLERAYVVRAMDDATLLMVDSAQVEAGRRDVVVRMPADALWPRVRGQIVSRTGAPVQRVTVRPMCDAQRLEVEPGGGSTMHATAASVETDEAGWFELPRVPKNLVYLRIDGENVLPLEYGRREPGGLGALAAGALAAGALDNLRIEVTLRVHVQLELADATRADGFRVLDAEDQVLPINHYTGRGRQTRETWPITDGRTEVVVIPDRAVALQLVRGEEIIERVPISPLPGDVNRISL